MKNPYLSPGPAFMATTTPLGQARVAIAGVPLDLGVTNRPGTRFGPSAIRMASRMLCDGVHPTHKIDPLAIGVADVGNFDIALGDIPKSLKKIEDQARPYPHLVTLGGEHTITYPLLRALHDRMGPVGLIHFDAHHDTGESNFGQSYGHGCGFRHILNEKLVDPTRMVQVGVRDAVSPATLAWTEAQGVQVIGAEDVHLSTPAVIADRIRAIVGTGPVYLSFDIDAFDPAFAPGTGTPTVGGLASWQAVAILRRLAGIQFVGMDIVEVAPDYDHAETTALLAASMVMEYLCLVPLALQKDR
jgi:agmatinase